MVTLNCNQTLKFENIANFSHNFIYNIYPYSLSTVSGER